MNAQTAIVPANGQEFRQSTDAAGLCGAIVKQTAKNIQRRRYVTVEGWQAIAIAHGCTASADNVERVTDEGASGFKCIGIVRRMSDGAEIARAEGFLGDDENMWTKRPVYARRAMVQTRAISRACRSAFAHVVVMIDAGLSTTPAEEVPDDGFDDAPREMKQARKVEGGMPDAEYSKLVQLIEATNADTGAMLKHYGVKNLRQLDQQQYGKAIAALKTKLANMAKEETNAKAKEEPADEFADLEDQIPY